MTDYPYDGAIRVGDRMIHLGLTPRFTIRVWGCPDRHWGDLCRLLGEPRQREPVAEIEVDTTELGDLTISGHRGLDIIPQKMLTR